MHPTTAASGPPRQAWWHDSRRRGRVVLAVFATLALASMLFVAFTNYLFAGDRRVLVVTMAQDADQADRVRLKQACGDLPSVTVVPDQGNPDPRIQGRFAVRFGISGATDPELAALQTCINGQPGVRGFLVDENGG